MKIYWLPLMLLFLLPLTQCEKMESRAEMSFARSTFESLARGDTTVANAIDWETFNSMGQNVGETYVKLPSELEKKNLEQAFVTQFAASFRETGSSPESFTNWRVAYQDELKTEVAADSVGGTLVITVTGRDGHNRVSSLGFVR